MASPAQKADLARLGQVTQARMSQIMSLLNLAPDLTVADNIMLGCEDHRLGWLRRGAQRERVERVAVGTVGVALGVTVEVAVEVAVGGTTVGVAVGFRIRTGPVETLAAFALLAVFAFALACPHQNTEIGLKQ